MSGLHISTSLHKFADDTMSFSLTDTHTHIYYAQDDTELDLWMDRCEENGVSKLLLPNVDRASIGPVFHTADRYPGRCFPMMGLHPCSVKADFREELAIIEKAVAANRIYAIGEIGLDLYWDKSTLPYQQEAFRIQATWAKNLGLPVSIHCREAYDELFVLLEELQDGRLYGVLHCFTGTHEQALRTIEMGLKLGIGGVVTFKKAGLDLVVKEIALEHLVLETDSPYLAPVPYRGKQNESSYLLYVAEKVADLKRVPLETVARITTETAGRIFGV